MEKLRRRAHHDVDLGVASVARASAPTVGRSPATRPDRLVLQLQRRAGNVAAGQLLSRFPEAGSLVANAGRMLGELLSTAAQLHVTASVGRDGVNRVEDVRVVSARLSALGFLDRAAEAELTAVSEAVSRYQGEVVGLGRPDGRVDPGGRTLRALSDGRRAAARPQDGPPGQGAPEPVEDTTRTASLPAGPAETTSPGSPAADVAAIRSDIADLAKDLAALTAQSRTVDKETAKANKALPKDAKKQQLNFGQETGPERDRLVDAIEQVRARIAALTPAGTGLDAAGLGVEKARLYRAADHLSPYYYQMVNANILHDKDTTGGGRTCNVTSLSMCLEAMGKSVGDFAGSTALLSALAEHFATALTDASDRGSGRIGDLRLPDFLQLLAVAACMDPATVGLSPQDPAFVAAVDKGREQAVDQILRPGFFISLTKPFGVDVDQDSTFDASTRELIDIVGEVNRAALPAALKKRDAQMKKGKDDRTDDEVRAAVVQYYDDKLAERIRKADEGLATMEAAPPGTSKSQQQKLDKKLAAARAELARLRTLQASDIYSRAIDPTRLDQLQPLDVYAAAVEEKLGAHLDAGHQIVGHVYHHFIRVEGVEDDGVRIDDPGSHAQHDFLLSWRRAREIGGFTRFTVLK